MIKHKVIKDFQVALDKKIFILKFGTILEDYKYTTKNDSIQIDKDLIDLNPDFFQILDWKVELVSYLRSNKIPQPAILAKKIIPFIEEMGLNSSPVNSSDLEEKLLEIESKERRILIKEEDVSIRQKRIESRESAYKDDLLIIDNKEKNLKSQLLEIQSSKIELDKKIQNLNEKERNFDRSSLKSTEEIDSKYKSIRDKIDEDLITLSEKENTFELKNTNLSQREISLLDKENILEKRIKDFQSIEEEFKLWTEDIKRIDDEISKWEQLNWKMKRMRVRPPSAES